MKSIKGREHNILVALNDSAQSVMAIDDRYIEKEDIEQLKAIRDILLANKDLLSSYYVDLACMISDFILKYYNRPYNL
jgi:hypothetical protein